MKDQDVFLVCARADATFTVRGSKFDRVCYRCGQAVMIAPSGIQRLEKETNIQILCVVCAINLMSVKTPDEVEVAPMCRMNFAMG